jgi:hypothetical protein
MIFRVAPHVLRWLSNTTKENSLHQKIESGSEILAFEDALERLKADLLAHYEGGGFELESGGGLVSTTTVGPSITNGQQFSITLIVSTGSLASRKSEVKSSQLIRWSPPTKGLDSEN